jgi:predicted nucleotidyltransferase
LGKRPRRAQRIAISRSEVDELLDALTDDLQQILGDRLVGAYLFGSVTRDDFDRESDVDVVVVTTDDLTTDVLAELAAMHARIASMDSWCATQLEVSYIPRKAIRRYDPPDVVHPRLDRGTGEQLHMMSHDADWVIQRHLIREHGTVLLGPPPQTLIDPVSGDEMRQAMRELLEEWLAPLLVNPPHVRTRGYQAFLVLSICRILYTLEHGGVISKRDAALWGEHSLDPRWTPLIRRGWIGRMNPDEPPSQEDLSDTRSFIEYAIEVGRR